MPSHSGNYHIAELQFTQVPNVERSLSSLRLLILHLNLIYAQIIFHIYALHASLDLWKSPVHSLYLNTNI